jgi:hypothetical protein
MRHLGPRFTHGCVTLQFSLAESFVFSSIATWPDANHDAAVRTGVQEALAERMKEPYAVAVVLKAIESDAVSSCEEGFRLAARAATLSSFVV